MNAPAPVRDGERPSTSGYASASQLAVLSLENKRLKEELAKVYEEKKEREMKLKETSCQLAWHQAQLDDKCRYSIEGDENENGNGKEPEEDDSTDLKELKTLLSRERFLRVKAEENLANMTESLKSFNKEYMRAVNEVKEYLVKEKEKEQSSLSFKELFDQVTTSLKERLDKKVKEMVELRVQAQKNTQRTLKLMKIIKSPQFKPVKMAPPPKNTGQPKNIVTLKKVIVQSAKVVKATKPPKKNVEVQTDDGAMTSAKNSGKAAPDKGSPLVITLDGDDDDDDVSPPVSPQLLPIDVEGNEIEMPDDFPMPILEATTSAAPPPPPAAAAAAAQSVEKPKKKKRSRKRATLQRNGPHGFPKETQNSKLFRCLCDNTYISLASLRSHIYTAQKEPKLGCSYCERKFAYPCFLNGHLKSAHGKIVVKSQAAKKAKRRLSSMMSTCAPKIKPPKEPVKNINLRQKRRKKAAEAEIINEVKDYKHSPHHQVSFGKSDMYKCKCEFTCAQKHLLMEHIAEEQRNV